MRTIQCMIVDDEPLARDLIHTYVSRLPGWHITAICKSATEAYEALCREEIDILFLDIEMPVISGIDFLRSLKKLPGIIFTTAHSQYAVSAFDLGAVDYLQKPVTEARFLQAIEKARNLLTQPTPPPTPAQELDYLFFRQDTRLVKIMLADILYVEALKDFSKIHLKDRAMLVGSHLKLIEALLPADRFVRTHRSYMIALKAVTAIQGNMIEIGPEKIPLGGLFKKEVFRKLNLPY